MAAIGIDLGTNNSCVAVYRDDAVEIIKNELGSRTTPSLVAFTDKKRLIGDEAKEQMPKNPSNTLFQIKRLIGRPFDDPVVTTDRQLFPFDIECDENEPKIVVQHQGEEKSFAPEEISAMLLSYMKQVAETHIGTTVKDAVITVPAYFNNRQRQATRDAGRIAGLNVLRLINEPTAAAIAYGLDKQVKQRTNVLIYDLGGGTFDVSIVVLEHGLYTVKSTSGDTHLGGADFDTRMVNHLIEEFKNKYNMDISKEKQAVIRLQHACESAKKLLSSYQTADVQIDSLFNGQNFHTQISRAEFEQLNMDLFKRTFVSVDTALSDAEMEKKDINEIVLVGGSSRIPLVQQMVCDYFPGIRINKSINPDEAVAYGAAVQAARLMGEESMTIQDLVICDVTPLSLGIEVIGSVMSTIVKRNTPIPTVKSEIFRTTRDNQTSVRIDVYEGERANIIDNHFLGGFTLDGIPPAPRGEAKIDVTFEIDADGILKVLALDKLTDHMENRTIVYNKGRLSEEEVMQVIAEAESFKNEDQQHFERVTALNNLDQYAYSMRQKYKNDEYRPAAQSVVDKCNEMIQWSERNRNATKEDFEQKLHLLKCFVNNVEN